MKKLCNFAFVMLLIFAVSLVVTGCSTTTPTLGQPTELQQILNALPEIPVAGKNLKFQFGGDTWIATVNSKNFIAGTFTSADNTDGSTLTLTQTHVYSSEKKPGVGGDIGWVKTPGPNIVLDYKKGPPASLSLK